MHKHSIAALSAAAVFALSACGSGSEGSDETSTSDTVNDDSTSPAASAASDGEPAELTEVTVALPVNMCLANWPFYVADQQGYFADAGLKVSLEGLDGSAAAIQATLAGQAQIAATAPADMLAASGSGADVTGYYSFYQYLPFSVVTLATSDVSDVASLEGKTIGISSPAGGDAVYMRSLLSLEGLDEGAYNELAVGEGEAAATALTGGTVDAYSASFVEEIVFTGMGIDYVTIDSEAYPAVAGEILMSQTEYFDANPNVIEGVGHSLAAATADGLADRDLVISTCGEVAPQETEDPDFANSVLDGVDPLFTPADDAVGPYGSIDEDEWAAYRELMINLGIAGDDAATTPVSNEYVEAWNSGG